MWVMHVERVEGEYIEPEIIDLEGGCLFRLHESDLHKDGAEQLSQLLTAQARRWAPRPDGAPLGPVISVQWERIPNPPEPLAVGVEESAGCVLYKADPQLISQRAADYLSRLETERSPHWQRVPEGYHDGDSAE